MSRGLVAYHFGSKSNLLVAAFERLCDDYREMLGIKAGQQPGLPDDAERKLLEVIRRSFEWKPGYKEREYAWFGFYALARTEPELREVNRRMNDEVTTYLGELMAAVARARGRVIDQQAAGHELAATIDGAWLHLTTGVEGYTSEHAIAMCQKCAERLIENDWWPSAAQPESVGPALKLPSRSSTPPA